MGYNETWYKLKVCWRPIRPKNWPKKRPRFLKIKFLKIFSVKYDKSWSNSHNLYMKFLYLAFYILAFLGQKGQKIEIEFQEK